jgi:hypothetical protein
LIVETKVSIAGKMVSGSEKMFSVIEKMVSGSEEMFSMLENISSRAMGMPRTDRTNRWS